MNDLTIVSVVEQDPGLVEIMIRSVLKFTDPAPKFIFCDNSFGKNVERITQALNGYKDYLIIPNKPKLTGGSNRHGDGLNVAVERSKSKYTAIVESDVAILHKDWCKIEPPFKVKAAAKGNHIYHACFFIFATDALSKMSWKPGNDSFNINYKPELDVGWRIKEHVRPDEIELVKFVDCKQTEGHFAGLQSDLFRSTNDGTILATHFGRGSNISGKANRMGFKSHREQLKEWKTQVEGFLK